MIKFVEAAHKDGSRAKDLDYQTTCATEEAAVRAAAVQLLASLFFAALLRSFDYKELVVITVLACASLSNDQNFFCFLSFMKMFFAFIVKDRLAFGIFNAPPSANSV